MSSRHGKTVTTTKNSSSSVCHRIILIMEELMVLAILIAKQLMIKAGGVKQDQEADNHDPCHRSIKTTGDGRRSSLIFCIFSDAMVVCHLPFGPTAYFTLYNVVMRHDVPDIGTMSEAYPHLVFHNFSSRLGTRVSELHWALLMFSHHLFCVAPTNGSFCSLRFQTSSSIYFRCRRRTVGASSHSPTRRTSSLSGWCCWTRCKCQKTFPLRMLHNNALVFL